ncbi:MAG: hypothetical protein M3165_01770, partial [Actinomycetota bacterium]|nr:hypothetical protein [Actinomycetota bacterium]
MGLSGFLYLAIVVGWAVYLVPFALKRYDEATRNRSVERFSSAMRVLGRHDADVPSSSQADANMSVAPPEVDRGPAVPLAAAREAQRTAARVAARRRRRVLLTLLLATAATAAGVAFLPSWSPAVPGTLLVLWLVVCRSQARREHAARPAYAVERSARPALGPDTIPVNEAGSAPADGVLDAVAEDVRADAAETDVVDVAPTEVPADDEPTVVLSREDLAEGEYAGPGSLWDPVPVTLPTYVH